MDSRAVIHWLSGMRPYVVAFNECVVDTRSRRGESWLGFVQDGVTFVQPNPIEQPIIVEVGTAKQSSEPLFYSAVQASFC